MWKLTPVAQIYLRPKSWQPDFFGTVFANSKSIGDSALSRSQLRQRDS
jgi:hypothetical protein